MRRRLLLTYLTLTALTLVALVVPLGTIFASREKDRLLQDIERDATVVASLSEDALEAGKPPDIADVLAEYAQDPGGRIVVVDADGRSVGDSADPGVTGESFANRPEVAEALQGKRSEGTRYSDTLGGGLVYVAVPVASGGEVHGAVRITYPTSTLDARVRDTWLRLGALSVSVLAAVTVLGYLLALGVTRPVQRLQDTSRAIAHGDLTARAPTGSGAPELRELASTFNETAAHLEQLVESQEAFVADASHQLRTPLAALRLRLENLEAEVPADLQPQVAAIRAETARLGRLAEGLLTLARAAGQHAAPETLDAAAVVHDRAAVWQPAAETCEVTLAVEAPREAPARAVPGALEQVLDNLISNALEVAPAGSVLTLAVGREHDRIAVHVKDQGPGLDVEQRARAFDRFWRAPDAGPGGTGLGLAVVKELALASGGRAELRATSEGGLDAVVLLHTAD